MEELIIDFEQNRGTDKQSIIHNEKAKIVSYKYLGTLLMTILHFMWALKLLWRSKIHLLHILCCLNQSFSGSLEKDWKLSDACCPLASLSKHYVWCLQWRIWCWKNRQHQESHPILCQHCSWWREEGRRLGEKGYTDNIKRKHPLVAHWIILFNSVLLCIF